MTYTLETLNDPVWEKLAELPDATWIWLDMVGGGLHRGPTLPTTVPSQLSHVWGWGPGWWVRGRADIDLPGRVAALVLRSAPAGDSGAVEVEFKTFRTWATKDNAVSASGSVDALPRQMRELVLRLPQATGSGLWRDSVSFVDSLSMPREKRAS